MTIESLAVAVCGGAFALCWIGLGWPRGGFTGGWLFWMLAAAASFCAHELIHGLFFKLLGGSGAHVSFGAKQGMLYASAHGLVLSRARFSGVLLAPAVLVSLGCLVLGVGLDAPLGFFAVFVVHLSGCTGDIEFVRAILGDARVRWVEDTESGIRLFGEDVDA